MMAAFGFFGRGAGPLVVPGKYTVTLAKRVDGVVTPLAGSQTFAVAADGPSSAADRIALADFADKLAKLQKALTATEESAAEARTRLDAIRRAVDATPSLPPKVYEQTLALERNLDEINLAIDYGLIPLNDLLQIMDSKPETVELILTGRNVNRAILERADLVTDMVDRKHYYEKGVPAREGIEI